MSDFIEIKPGSISDNPFKLIGGDWMLITAGDLKSFNTMTASWGGLGVLWQKLRAMPACRRKPLGTSSSRSPKRQPCCA